MFSIRRILDASAPPTALSWVQVQDILRTQVDALKDHEVTDLPKLNDAMKYRFQSRLLVSQHKTQMLTVLPW